jgi:hypothetical protein
MLRSPHPHLASPRNLLEWLKPRRRKAREPLIVPIRGIMSRVHAGLQADRERRNRPDSS